MYGTDWPLVEMGPYVKFMEKLGFEGDAKERVSWKTAADLFKIDVSKLGKSS